jgi:hypothetical protein
MKSTIVYPPISEEGYRALQQWLREAHLYVREMTPSPPDDGLLRVGLPQGSIVTITLEGGLLVRDTATLGLRSPRWLDPPALALVRLLLAGGGSVGLNRKNMHRPDRKDYLHVRATLDGRDYKVPVLRIIADTPVGYQTPAANDHCSYRRGDLPQPAVHHASLLMTVQGLPTKYPHLGRHEAVSLACGQLRKSRRHMSFSLSEKELRATIQVAFRLLDMIPLRQTPGT